MGSFNKCVTFTSQVTLNAELSVAAPPVNAADMKDFLLSQVKNLTKAFFSIRETDCIGNV
jgi:hypothetical protein